MDVVWATSKRARRGANSPRESLIYSELPCGTEMYPKKSVTYVTHPPSFMDRKSGMRREGTPVWMQVVERRRERAAEEARSRPAQARL